MKTKGLKLKEVNNGWNVTLIDDIKGGEYVYSSNEAVRMVEELALFIIGKKYRLTDTYCRCREKVDGPVAETNQADSPKAE